MHFPKSTRLPRERYSRTEARFHVTFNAHPEISTWPRGVGETIWGAVLEQAAADRVELFAACLMPDHLHLLLRPSSLDLIQFANTWKSWTTRLAWSEDDHGAVWQPGMWDRTIRDETDFEATVEYIVMNPVGGTRGITGYMALGLGVVRPNSPRPAGFVTSSGHGGPRVLSPNPTP